MPAGTEIKSSVFSPVERVKKEGSVVGVILSFVRFHGFGALEAQQKKKQLQSKHLVGCFFIFFTVLYITGLK
jgi:hypothetical protein